MHLKRWLTAIVAIPFLVAIIIKAPPLMFTAFIGVVAMIALWEYYPIALFGKMPQGLPLIPVWGALAGLAVIGAAGMDSLDLIPGFLLINLIGAAVLSMSHFGENPKILAMVSAQIQGLVYIPLSLAAIVLLRNGSDGVAWVFFLLFIVFSGDVGAFYAGRFFGRRKLSPSISPGKTIEGAVGGLVTSIVVGFGFYLVFLPHLNPVVVFGLLICVNPAAQAGDLFESQLKRAANVKDSGNILPGHGGMLDRIDALLFAAPVAWVFKTFIMTGV
jgi:phosphatidate cytidylyltransferase